MEIKQYSVFSEHLGLSTQLKRQWNHLTTPVAQVMFYRIS